MDMTTKKKGKKAIAQGYEGAVTFVACFWLMLLEAVLVSFKTFIEKKRKQAGFAIT